MPKAVMDSVIMPLEESINGERRDMMYITSSASNAGLTIIQVYFKQGTDPDMAAVSVQNGNSQSTGTAARRSNESQCKHDETPDQLPANRRDGLHRRSLQAYQTFAPANYLDINVIPQIKRIEGIRNVMELGDTYGMRIWLKLERDGTIRAGAFGHHRRAGRRQNIEALPAHWAKVRQSVFQFTMKYRAGEFEGVEEFQNTVDRSS